MLLNIVKGFSSSGLFLMSFLLFTCFFSLNDLEYIFFWLYYNVTEVMGECCDSCQMRNPKAWQGLAVTRKKREAVLGSITIQRKGKKRAVMSARFLEALIWTICVIGKKTLSARQVFLWATVKFHWPLTLAADIYNSCSIHRIKQQFEIPITLLITLYLSWSSYERSIIHLSGINLEKLKLYFASILPPCDGKLYITQPPCWPEEENQEPN